MLFYRVDPLKSQPTEIERPLTPATRTVMVQTDYRDSEAQTDPYTPEYVVRPGSQPELLTLATLSYGKTVLMMMVTIMLLMTVVVMMMMMIIQQIIQPNPTNLISRNV